MYLTDYLGLPQGHSGIDFVDIHTGDDTRLFLDPCLIEIGTDEGSKEAAATIADFEEALFREMRSGNWKTTRILEQAHEIHDTKLGYGNGRNGRGKTPEGLRESLNGLYVLANQIGTISQLQDVNIFVKDFAEDCMSDLLTNVLHHHLCQFTNSHMNQMGKTPSGVHKITYWSSVTHSWETEEQPIWEVCGVPVLMVPKRWVRSRYLCNAHQYLFIVIIERMRERDGIEDVPKQEIWQGLERGSEHWEYDYVTEYTQDDSDALREYHMRMLHYYRRAYGQMTDDALDEATYGYAVTEIA